MDLKSHIVPFWIVLKSTASAFLFFLEACFYGFYAFLVGLVHCLRDPQIYFSVKLSFKIGSTVQFIYLKIILLWCFQFSTINGIAYPSEPIVYF